ncbi:RNA-binding protein [Candidatus Woesearchaeota archaeon]|nr:RNA-binding protein [Candidatus Woesearchaeota archaeon]
MEKLNIKDKDLAVPGEELAEGMEYLPSSGTYREGNKIIAAQLGIISLNGNVIKIIPLSGRYIPRVGDVVIGRVTNVGFNNWFVDIGYAYEAVLPLKEASSEYIDVERGGSLSKYYDFGDYIMCGISKVSRSMATDVSMRGPGLKKLKGGKIIRIAPSKVPRLIGKQGSMINLIKDKTGCRISVGQNGWVWIQAEDPKAEMIATHVIEEINKKAHNPGLTDEITNLLSKETQK